MGAGKYNKQITFQQRLTTTDSWGETQPSWVTFRSGVWADVLMGEGKEFFAAKKSIPQLTAIVRIRPLRGLKNSMQVVMDGETYIITTIVRGKVEYKIHLTVVDYK